MKKNFIVGFLSGAVLFGTLGVVAANVYNAYDNPFPVQLNGNNVDIEGYNINDETYFKLRDVASVVGGFDVGFGNSTIRLSKDGYVYEDNFNSPMSGKNPYNGKYIDVSGRTVQDLAEEEGITLEEFLEANGLPNDMPADTTEAAAYNMIPLRIVAEMYGMDYEEMYTVMNFPDYVNENTPWGEALDEVTLRDYVGEENIAEFKDAYGLGDDINEDTKWKEVRDIVDRQSQQERINAEM